MPADNRYNLLTTEVVRTKPQVRIKPDFYGDGGTFNPLEGGGPESDFRPVDRTMWPAPTIPEGGTPATFLRHDDYPFDPNSGMPKDTVRVNEGETALAVRIDKQKRPTQLIEMEKVALPFKPGEGPRYASSSDVPLDPSAVSMATMGVKATKAGFFGGAFGRRQTSGMAGLGQLEPLAALALGPIQAAMSAIKNREASLQAEAPEVLAAITGPYSVLRGDIDRYYSEMVADPAKVTTSGISFAAAAATYKNVLDTAIGKLNDAKAKAKSKAKARAAAEAAAIARQTVKNLPGAVVQTAKSPYGMIVLGVGAAVVAGLFIIRAMQKKGD